MNYKQRRRKRVGDYGEYEVQEAQCPVCKEWFTMWSNGYIYRSHNISQHIQKQGKTEITLHGKMSKNTPHYKYFYDNSKVEIVQIRRWK